MHDFSYLCWQVEPRVWLRRDIQHELRIEDVYFPSHILVVGAGVVEVGNEGPFLAVVVDGVFQPLEGADDVAGREPRDLRWFGEERL